MRRWFVLVAAIGLLMCAGCGGGGGSAGCVGTATPSDVSYRTEWSGISGQSQVIQLLSEGGTVLQSRILNRGENQISFTSTNSGLYRMRAELRSAANGAGAVVGLVDAAFEVCGTTTFSTRTGGSPSAMKIYPSSFSLVENSSQRFYAAPINSDGDYFFTPSATVNWSVLGSGAVIDSTGLLTAQSAGNINVQATDVSSGVTGTAPVTINTFTPTQTKWTILVFLNAANDLYPFSTLNVNQMEKVANNPQVRFVVQWKQSRSAFPGATFDGTKRFLVKPDGTDAIASQVVQNMGGSVDMGAWTSLRDFIAWGRANYPSDRLGLIIWNHGNGWQRGVEPTTRAVSYDDETGNAIQIWQLPQALAGQQLDFLAWDASLMQMLEVAYEVRNQTKFIIGSEESPPGEGYPYDAVFGPFRSNPDLPTSALTRNFVDAMVNHPPYASRKITQSVIDSSKLDALAGALDSLAVELIATGGTLNPVIQSARNNTQSYSPTAQRTYRDLWQIAEALRTGVAVPPEVVNAAAAVQAALVDAVVWEGHNVNSPGSRGIAIDFSSGGSFTAIQSDYNPLALAIDTRWDNWLRIAP